MNATATAAELDEQIATIWNDPDHVAWAAAGARLRRFVQRVAGRGDLTTELTPDPGRVGAPACFIPSLGEVRFNAAELLVPHVTHPGEINPDDELQRLAFPQVLGAAAHEAAHAAHTRWEIPAGTPAGVARWVTVLEEPRIEGKLLARAPQHRGWLQASAAWVLADDDTYQVPADAGTDQATLARAAVHTAVLIVGRQRAGVLPAALVQQVVDTGRAVLGDDTYAQVETAIDLALAAADTDIEQLLVAARILDQIVAAPQDQAQDQDTQDEQEGQGDQNQGQGQGQGEGSGEQQPGSPDGSGRTGNGTPSPTEGTGSGDPAGSGDPGEPSGQPSPGSGTGSESGAESHRMPCGAWTPGDDPADPTARPNTPTPGDADTNADSDLGDKLRDMAQQARKALSQATEETLAPHRARLRPAQAATADQIEEMNRAAAKKEATKIFGGPGGTTPAGPIRVNRYTPGPKVLDQTAALSRALRQARYRGIDKTKLRELAPPGRLNTSELARREGQVAAHRRVTATPWQRTRRREVDQPTLRVGISGDVSGSQEAAQRRTAEITFAIANAVHGRAGKVAAVAWNTQVAATLAPGQVPTQVPEARCSGGTSACAESLLALDGALRLTADETGARVVVVITDGYLASNTIPATNEQIKRLTKAGVLVLWVIDTHNGATVDSSATVVVVDPSDPNYGQIIGKHLADALSDA